MSRGFTYQSSRAVNFNAELSQTTSPSQTLELLCEPENLKSIPYGLRIMTQNIRKNPRSLSSIFTPEFFKVKELLLSNIDTFNGQDMTDILYFARTLNFYKKNILKGEEKKLLVARVEELIEQQELTARQVFSVFGDFAKLNTNINSLERAASDMMQSTDQALGLPDVKIMLQGLNVNLHKSYFRSIRSAVTRLKTQDLAQVQTSNVIEILEEICRHAVEYPYASLALVKYTQELVNRINIISESELLRLLSIPLKVEMASAWLLSVAFNSIKDRLSADPRAFTPRFLGQLSSVLIDLKKKTKTFIPDSLVSIVAESALVSYKAERPSDFEIVRVIDLLAVCRARREEGKVAELLSLRSQDYREDNSLGQFILLNALTVFKSVPASTVLAVDTTRATFLNLNFFAKLQALCICSQSHLSKEWTDLIAELEETTVLDVEACSYQEVSNSVARLTNYPEVLYSKVALPKLKAAVSAYTDAQQAPTRLQVPQLKPEGPHLLRSVERASSLPADCLERR
jgi:hypothetical protein